MCAIVGTGNPPLPLSMEQCRDTGTRRRMNHSKMPKTFTLAEDKDLKKPAMDGKGNAELFFLSKLLFPYVQTLGKRVFPIPPRIKKETKDLLDSNVVAEIKAWVELHTEGVEDYNAATVSAKLRLDIAAAIPAADGNDAAFRSAGIYFERRNNMRFCTYMYPGQNSPLNVQVTNN